MNRRQFFTILVKCSVATATVSSVGSLALLGDIGTRINALINGCRCKPWRPYRERLCNKCKEAIIARLLATEEGRRQLANAMVEPRRGQLEYI